MIYNKEKTIEEINYTVSDAFLTEGVTLYAKVKNHMLSLDEASSKKYFYTLRSEKILDLLQLEKKLIDIS